MIIILGLDFVLMGFLATYSFNNYTCTLEGMLNGILKDII